PGLKQSAVMSGLRHTRAAHNHDGPVQEHDTSFRDRFDAKNRFLRMLALDHNSPTARKGMAYSSKSQAPKPEGVATITAESCCAPSELRRRTCTRHGPGGSSVTLLVYCSAAWCESGTV